MPAEYVLYGADFSLFTRKLESALEFYDAPFRKVVKDAENGPGLEVRSGTHQLPVLGTPENWILADTTPIIATLDARFPRRRLFPEGPLGVLVHIAEEVLDEWVARTMVHYRWHYPENARFVVSQILGREVSPEEAAEFPLARWGPRACRATGTETVEQQKACEAEYMALMDALEAQLEVTPFALGTRPSAVDTILIGGLRAHTDGDPIPDLGAWPRTRAYAHRSGQAWRGDGEWAAFPRSTPLAEHLLAVCRDAYVPFLLGNARALEAGTKAFEITTYGSPVSYLARPYPERSRQMIRDRIAHQLGARERSEVEAWLEANGLAEAFAP